MKTCIKCKISGEDDCFKKAGNICKKCINKYEKERKRKKPRQYNPTEIKICNKCGTIGEAVLFVKFKTTCKKCRSKREKELKLIKLEQYDPFFELLYVTST